VYQSPRPQSLGCLQSATAVLLPDLSQQHIREADCTPYGRGTEGRHQGSTFVNRVSLSPGRLEVTRVHIGQTAGGMTCSKTVPRPQHQPDDRRAVVNHDTEDAAWPEHAVRLAEGAGGVRRVVHDTPRVNQAK
jgi:hypothetical protein